MVDTDTPCWYETVAKFGGDHRTLQENIEVKQVNQRAQIGSLVMQPKKKPARKRTSPPIPAMDHKGLTVLYDRWGDVTKDQNKAMSAFCPIHGETVISGCEWPNRVKDIYPDKASDA